MKKIIDFTLKENKRLTDDFVILRLAASEELPEIQPGQFAEVRVDHSPGTYLRRPFSINRVSREEREIQLLIQEVGEGTHQLASLQAGATVNIMLPLGNRFSLPERKDERILLIGGGCGAAPLLFFGEELKALGYKPEFLIGARDKEHLLFCDEYEALGTLYITTNDGSKGEKGFVVHHPILANDTPNFDRIYSCGPEAMMRSVGKVARKHNIFCEVSLENTMACGIGACLCCVVKTRQEGHQCVCTKGPVFNINDLDE